MKDMIGELYEYAVGLRRELHQYPEVGIDAVAVAVEAYENMKAMLHREAGQTKYIWSVGRFQGGHVHNVIADLCEMDISFRFYDTAFAERIEKMFVPSVMKSPPGTAAV